jgi:hypothetical protein
VHTVSVLHTTDEVALFVLFAISLRKPTCTVPPYLPSGLAALSKTSHLGPFDPEPRPGEDGQYFLRRGIGWQMRENLLS